MRICSRAAVAASGAATASAATMDHNAHRTVTVIAGASLAAFRDSFVTAAQVRAEDAAGRGTSSASAVRRARRGGAGTR